MTETVVGRPDEGEGEEIRAAHEIAPRADTRRRSLARGRCIVKYVD
jgi:hypothetical protein